MTRLFKIGFFVAVSLFFTQTISAQKVGFVNSQALLLQVPEVKTADTQLDEFQKMLGKKGQNMVESFQKKATDLEAKRQKGEIAPLALEQETKKLEDERTKIAEYEQEMMKQLQQKREELFKPLLDKVQTAINDVAKAKGLVYVFDNAANVFLYADETLDISNDVKTKLGISLTPPSTTTTATTPAKKN